MILNASGRCTPGCTPATPCNWCIYVKGDEALSGPIKLPVRVEESLCVGLAGEPEWMIVDATGCMVEEFSTRNRAECRAAALNAQERASEPATQHPMAYADYCTACRKQPCVCAPAAMPWEWTGTEERQLAAAANMTERTGVLSGKRARWVCIQLRAALAHIADLERALDMQRQATEEAVRRAEAAQRELSDRNDATELAIQSARAFEKLWSQYGQCLPSCASQNGPDVACTCGFQEAAR